jgi:regulator of replication initiation timing
VSLFNPNKYAALEKRYEQLELDLGHARNTIVEARKKIEELQGENDALREENSQLRLRLQFVVEPVA